MRDRHHAPARPGHLPGARYCRWFFRDLFGELKTEDFYIANKRTEKAIWHNLYQFPLLETATTLDDETILSLIKEQNFIANEIDTVALYNTENIIHKLSHQHLTIKFWKVTVKGKINGGIDCKSATEFPFPIVIFNFISKYWF